MRVATSARDEGAVTGSGDITAIQSSMTKLVALARRYIAPKTFVATAKSLIVPASESGSEPNKGDDRAVMMAMTLAMFTPSLMGGTAFSRAARVGKTASAADAAAWAALHAAQLRLLRVQSVGGGIATCIDLASGEAVRVVDEGFGPPTVGVTFIAFMAAVQGVLLFVNAPVSLDAAAQEVAMRYVRPGKTALVQPLKCAEAVYLHVLLHGGPCVPGIDAPLPRSRESAGAGPLDVIAMTWSMQAAGAPRDARHIKTIRNAMNLDSILATLISAVKATGSGHKELGGAYEAIVLVQLETVERRAAIGSGRLRLETIEQEMEVAIQATEMPPETLPLFRGLCARLGAGRGGKATNVELEKVIARIQALRAKTVERGCTEQEAMAAAEKVAELLDRYGMSLGETELREQSCDGTAVETGRSRMGPIDQCIPATARFFDCQMWIERTEVGFYRYIFFGMPADVAAARYLYDLVEAAFDCETAEFQDGALYGRLQGQERRKARESFQVGLADGIVAKLEQIRAERDKVRTSSGRQDLVVVKEEVLERELEALGINFSRRRSSSGRTVMPGAFAEGQRAGMKFDYRPGVGHEG